MPPAMTALDRIVERNSATGASAAAGANGASRRASAAAGTIWGFRRASAVAVVVADAGAVRYVASGSVSPDGFPGRTTSKISWRLAGKILEKSSEDSSRSNSSSRPRA